MPLVINSIENLGGDYSLYTWPCAPVLAQYIYKQRYVIRGKRILELGAGTAVPGLTAAKCGGHVTFSDREGNPHLHDNIKRSCELNSIDETGTDILEITWGVLSPKLLKLPPQDFVIASDCFYDSKDFEDVLATVSFLFDKNPGCKFWTTYQERSSNHTLVHLLERWGLQCTVIPTESFFDQDEDDDDRVVIEGPSENNITTEHTIHMWEIVMTKRQ